MLTPEQARQQWRGVVAPIVTPFAGDGAVDLEALRANVAWLFERGARPGNTILLVAGSGGDWPMMNLDERRAVIEAVAEVNAGRLPIIAGAQSFDIRESAAIARFCEGLRVDAIQISAPAYWTSRPGDVLAWLTELASRTWIPFALYNNWYTGYNMSFELIDQLLELPEQRRDQVDRPRHRHAACRDRPLARSRRPRRQQLADHHGSPRGGAGLGQPLPEFLP